MKNKESITTLFLDIGGVLLTNGWDHASRALAATTFNLDFKEMESRHNLMSGLVELGKISLNEYLRWVVFYEKRPFGPKEFETFMLSQSQALPHMIEAICQLKARFRLKIVAVSNEMRELNAYRIEKFNLNSVFDFYISSCFVGLRKPDKAMFLLALDASQTPANRVAYIDDRPLFVDIARELSLHGIHHTGVESTLAKLSSLGLGNVA